MASSKISLSKDQDVFVSNYPRVSSVEVELFYGCVTPSFVIGIVQTSLESYVTTSGIAK